MVKRLLVAFWWYIKIAFAENRIYRTNDHSSTFRQSHKNVLFQFRPHYSGLLCVSNIWHVSDDRWTGEPIPNQSVFYTRKGNFLFEIQNVEDNRSRCVRFRSFGCPFARQPERESLKFSAQDRLFQWMLLNVHVESQNTLRPRKIFLCSHLGCSHLGSRVKKRRSMTVSFLVGLNHLIFVSPPAVLVEIVFGHTNRRLSETMSKHIPAAVRRGTPRTISMVIFIRLIWATRWMHWQFFNRSW